MEYYFIRCDVAGGRGENTVFERKPGVGTTVHKLHYVFEDWFGDAIVESIYQYIVTEGAAIEIQKHGLTGVEFDEVEVSTSEEFDILNPNLVEPKLPKFVWLKITGEAGKDDFGRNRSEDLMISERALNVLKQQGIPHAKITPCNEINVTPSKFEKGQSKPLRLLQNLRSAIVYVFGGGNRD